jgi:DNA-binding transcriptional LysR family regulator
MSDRFQELSVFARVVESRSFSRAARELGLSQPSVSRIVNELEQRLGVKLVLRTTRRIVPTDAGARFLQDVRPVLRALEEAENAARAADSLSGSLRIAMSVAFGVREVIPILPPFLTAHPGLKVEFMISDDQQDLIAEGADVAIRLGLLPDSGFGARRLATAPRLVIGSPAYLAARGVPKTLSDLSSHDCVFGPGKSARAGWTFIRDGALVPITVNGRIQTASAEGVIACVRAGLGLAAVSVWMCRDELGSGAVVPVLADYALEPVEAHAVFPSGPHPSSKVRALVDHLVAALGNQPPQAVRPPSGS